MTWWYQNPKQTDQSDPLFQTYHSFRFSIVFKYIFKNTLKSTISHYESLYLQVVLISCDGWVFPTQEKVVILTSNNFTKWRQLKVLWSLRSCTLFKKHSINLIDDFHIEANIHNTQLPFSHYFHYPFYICSVTLGKYYYQEGKAIKHL